MSVLKAQNREIKHLEAILEEHFMRRLDSPENKLRKKSLKAFLKQVKDQCKVIDQYGGIRALEQAAIKGSQTTELFEK